MSASDDRSAAIAACPTPEYHATHRYCPSCPWTEADEPGYVSTARGFWGQDATGRDTCLALTYTDDDAQTVWDALKRAQVFLVERHHDDSRYKGRFVRGWSEEDGYFWDESPDVAVDRANAAALAGSHPEPPQESALTGAPDGTAGPRLNGERTTALLGAASQILTALASGDITPDEALRDWNDQRRGCYEECDGDDGCPGDWPLCDRRLVPDTCDDCAAANVGPCPHVRAASAALPSPAPEPTTAEGLSGASAAGGEQA